MKRNGTSLVLETVNTQMDPDPTGLPGLGIGRLLVLTKLSQQKDVKLVSRKLLSFTLAKPQKEPKLIGLCMNTALLNPLAKMEARRYQRKKFHLQINFNLF